MINQYDNVIDILQRMGQVSDDLHDSKDSRALGFDTAYGVLKYAIKKWNSTNFHLELKLLRNDNTALIAKNENQKAEIKRLNEVIFKLKFGGKDDILF